MKEINRWIRRLADSADLAEEPLPGMPVIELAGEGRVLIERHGGVTAYSTERVCVKMAYGSAAITGCNLEMTRMTRDQLIISGRIDGVLLMRRER